MSCTGKGGAQDKPTETTETWKQTHIIGPGTEVQTPVEDALNLCILANKQK